MKRYKTVDEFMADAPEHWRPSLQALRELLDETEMEETVKWGMPVYTVNNKNVAGMGFFKSYAGIWFYQGVFLKDPAKKLINAQEGRTKAMRQWRFDSFESIDKDLVKTYLHEAIENAKAGKEIKPEKKPLEIPAELQSILDSDSRLNTSFEELNLTKKREFAEYIETAKRVGTKNSRLEKIVPLILDGVGLNDKYR